ncbi:hypothetical protein [Comamonas sp. JC664]|uniref:hypothetical protein n=1 Tax=Comamonas sp. JC664 TaxID=2801917 RepID=UPI00360BC163
MPHSQISWQPAPATAPGSTLLLLTGDDRTCTCRLPRRCCRTACRPKVRCSKSAWAGRCRPTTLRWPIAPRSCRPHPPR